MRQQRRNFSSPGKMAILREHLIDKVPVSEVCEKHGLNPQKRDNCLPKTGMLSMPVAPLSL